MFPAGAELPCQFSSAFPTVCPHHIALPSELLCPLGFSPGCAERSGRIWSVVLHVPGSCSGPCGQSVSANSSTPSCPCRGPARRPAWLLPSLPVCLSKAGLTWVGLQSFFCCLHLQSWLCSLALFPSLLEDCGSARYCPTLPSMAPAAPPGSGTSSAPTSRSPPCPLEFLCV